MIDKETLIQQFRAYLEESETPPPPGEESVDLFRLFTELAALKNEVRIESRQVKEALDRFRGLVAPLQEGLDAARAENQRLKADKGQELRPLLLELVELRDRLVAGLDGADAPPRKLLQRLCRQERELLAGWREGQGMILRRLDQLLAARGVKAVAVLQRPLDPHIARAVAVDQRQDVADGVVVAELRAGFLWRDELLRPAEVVVNRLRGE